MVNEKRLIDANAFQFEPDPWGGINGVLFMGRGTGKTLQLVRSCLQAMIDNAPTVDAVEVVHGRWEDVCEIKSFKHTNIPVVECSNCVMRFCDIINNHHFMYHYCPYCGADMRGGNEDV